MKIIQLISFFLLCSLDCSAQMLYPIVGAYKGKSAQGMAIGKDKAYLFNDGGYSRIIDLKNGDVIGHMTMGSAGKGNHVATACFGLEYSTNSDIPVIYLAEFAGKSRCFVESIKDTTSVLLQTIEAKENGKNYRIQCWLVDTESAHLYSVSGKQSVDSLGHCPVTVRGYRLPKLSEGHYVLLTEKDKKDEFVLDFPNCLQGATIRKGKIYLVTGFQQSQANNPRSGRSLKIIDLRKKRIVKDIDLTLMTTNEPEGLDFYNNNLLLYCGQEGGIYQLKY